MITMQLMLKIKCKKASEGKQEHQEQWMQSQLQGKKEGNTWQPEPAAGREGVKQVQWYQGQSCRPSGGMFPQQKRGQNSAVHQAEGTTRVGRNFADEDVSISAAPH